MFMYSVMPSFVSSLCFEEAEDYAARTHLHKLELHPTFEGTITADFAQVQSNARVVPEVLHDCQ